ncbi:MAG: M48 family metalloprotease [Gemmatimonadetes bacterium]|nr:M48 family metalloprotease [Gemmatimonadota bacterium]
MVKDAQVVRYITQLGEQLAAATDTRGLTWHFTVVDSREVNAFAVPGGWIYVNRGLIERAENMSQVAGVLAHEIGHVTRRHSVQQMQQAQGANSGVSLLCTLTKVCNSSTGQAAINLGGTALFAKFSRRDESEADAEAVATTIKAGIDPSGIPGMFRILLSEQQRNPERPRGILPDPPTRGGSGHGDRSTDCRLSPECAPCTDQGNDRVPGLSPTAPRAPLPDRQDAVSGGVSMLRRSESLAGGACCNRRSAAPSGSMPTPRRAT